MVTAADAFAAADWVGLVKKEENECNRYCANRDHSGHFVKYSGVNRTNLLAIDRKCDVEIGCVGLVERNFNLSASK